MNMNILRSTSRLLIQIQKTKPLSLTGKRYINRTVYPIMLEISNRKKNLKNPLPTDPPRSEFLDWNYEAEIYAFNHRLNEKFDTELLTQALTHHSYVLKEKQKQRAVGIEDPELNIEDNRELIEKGRNLTSKIVEIYLGSALPRAPEECILALHDHLMSEDVLANSSSLIGTKDIILTEEYPPTSETSADTFLALVAALAESVDEIHASKFVRDFLIAPLSERDLAELWNPEEPLAILNDILVRDGREPAEPRIIGQSGVNTLIPVYRIGLYSDKKFISSGTENNIEDAVNVAALNALYSMFDLAASSRPMKFNLEIDPSLDEMKNLPLQEWCTQNLSKLMQ